MPSDKLVHIRELLPSHTYCALHTLMFIFMLYLFLLSPQSHKHMYLHSLMYRCCDILRKQYGLFVIECKFLLNGSVRKQLSINTRCICVVPPNRKKACHSIRESNFGEDNRWIMVSSFVLNAFSAFPTPFAISFAKKVVPSI